MNDFIFSDDDINILIVEDEIILAMALEVSLQNMGFTVSGIETSAEQSINHTKNNVIDIVIMDINLKNKMSGIDAAKIIWNLYKIPIIFLTSYANNTTIREAMECEPYAYLVKPYKKKELKAAILTSLHKHRFFFTKKLREEKDEKNNIVNFEGELSFDKKERKLKSLEVQIVLTKNETKFFEIMISNNSNAVSFEEISSFIWRESIYDLGRLRTLVYRINKKIENNPIKNIHNFGYRLEIV